MGAAAILGRVPQPSVVPPRHVYVHVPFCARRCSYCDFAIAVRRVVPVREYVDALVAELELRWGRAAGVLLGQGSGSAMCDGRIGSYAAPASCR